MLEPGLTSGAVARMANTVDISSGAEPDSLDLDILANLIGYHIHRAQVRVYRDFLKNVSTGQITPAQYTALTLIHANPGLSQTALGKVMETDKAPIMGLIDRLQDRGLVQRKRSTRDRRRHELYLTKLGERTLHKLDDNVIDQDRRLCTNISRSEKKKLIELLRRVYG